MRMTLLQHVCKWSNMDEDKNIVKTSLCIHFLIICMIRFKDGPEPTPPGTGWEAGSTLTGLPVHYGETQKDITIQGHNITYC